MNRRHLYHPADPRRDRVSRTGRETDPWALTAYHETQTKFVDSLILVVSLVLLVVFLVFYP